MPHSVMPTIKKFAAGQIDFADLVAYLVAFDWSKPVPEVDRGGDYPEHDFGQIGTFEQVEAALILGLITQEQFDVISDALNAELVRRHGPDILQPKR